MSAFDSLCPLVLFFDLCFVSPLSSFLALSDLLCSKNALLSHLLVASIKPSSLFDCLSFFILHFSHFSHSHTRSSSSSSHFRTPWSPTPLSDTLCLDASSPNPTLLSATPCPDASSLKLTLPSDTPCPVALSPRRTPPSATPCLAVSFRRATLPLDTLCLDALSLKDAR